MSDGGSHGDVQLATLPGPGSMLKEREAKLVAPFGLQLPDFDGVVKGAEAVRLPVRRLDATYYDTAELRLARWRITLRYRTGGPGPPWTLKLPDRQTTPALVRRELSFDGGAETVPEAARDLVRAYVRTHPLAPVARLVISRTPIEIRGSDGQQLGEIVDDVVSVYRRRRRTGQFREIEVEVDTGAGRRAGRKLVGAAVARLVHAGCQPEPPIPKVVRALGPHAAEAPDVVVPSVDAGAPAGVLIRNTLARSVIQLLRHDPGVRLGEDPEGVHQFRVASRQLRSELGTFRPLLDDAQVRSLRAELRWLGGEVGAARDADVLAASLRAEAQSLPAPDASAGDELLALLADRAHEARAAMLAALRSTRYDQLLDALLAAAAQPPVESSGRAEQPATKVVTRLVRRAWRRLADGVNALDDNPSDAALHRARILAKRCRYAAEAVAPVIGRPAARFAAAIAEVQTVLGDHQDTVVAEAWLRQAAAAEPRTGVAAGQLIARLLARRARIRAEWPERWERASARKLRSWL